MIKLPCRRPSGDVKTLMARALLTQVCWPRWCPGGRSTRTPCLERWRRSSVCDAHGAVRWCRLRTESARRVAPRLLGKTKLSSKSTCCARTRTGFAGAARVNKFQWELKLPAQKVQSRPVQNTDSTEIQTFKSILLLRTPEVILFRREAHARLGSSAAEFCCHWSCTCAALRLYTSTTPPPPPPPAPLLFLLPAARARPVPRERCSSQPAGGTVEAWSCWKMNRNPPKKSARKGLKQLTGKTRKTWKLISYFSEFSPKEFKLKYFGSLYW